MMTSEYIGPTLPIHEFTLLVGRGVGANEGCGMTTVPIVTELADEYAVCNSRQFRVDAVFCIDTVKGDDESPVKDISSRCDAESMLTEADTSELDAVLDAFVTVYAIVVLPTLLPVPCSHRLAPAPWVTELITMLFGTIEYWLEFMYNATVC
jgi:hypothetical protein